MGYPWAAESEVSRSGIRLPDLALYEGEVLFGEQVDVALKGQVPVLRRPSLHVFQVRHYGLASTYVPGSRISSGLMPNRNGYSSPFFLLFQIGAWSS